jgi:copper homeostasis protein
MPTQLEIAVTSVEDARQAAEGGADSLEISRALHLGGLTPPLEQVAAVREAVSLPLYVLIREQARDFVYTPAEMDIMLAQVAAVKRLGVAGVVFGALTASGQMDMDTLRAVVRAASPLPVTLHRALDSCRQPQVALSRLTGLIPRVLTAGPAPTAWAGRATVAGWVRQFGAHFTFVSSGGLTLAQLPAFIAQVRPSVVHLGGAARGTGGVEAARVRALRQAVDS